MKHLILFTLFFISLPVVAQTGRKDMAGYVQGTVYDEKTRETILSASIRILSSDSVYVQGMATGEKGKFRMPVSAGNYILEVSFIGYKTFLQNFNISPVNPVYVSDSIFLHEAGYMLKAAIVEAKVPDIVVKGDTIEYTAGAYSSQESDMLQDMVRNIPGIEIDANGNITANGKPVKKILVDGKEFFGNDIPMALNNLPANMIKKLQLYKETSEESRITGFKDKDPEQVINLVVKEELKQSIFGDIKAGYGSDDKYAGKAMVNFMRSENQVSLVGDMNNVNDNEYTAGMDNGIDKNKNAGVSAQIKASEKLKLGGSLRYSNNGNRMDTKTNTETFLKKDDGSPANRFSENNMSAISKRENLNFSLNMEWRPDSLTTVYARSYAGFNNSENNNISSNLSFVTKEDPTSSQSVSLSKGDGYNVNSYLTIGRKLNNRGRTVSLSLNSSIRNDDSDGSNYSRTAYSDGTEDKIIDQLSKTGSKTNGYNLSFSYVEPMGKDRRLQFAYSVNNNDSDRDRNVRKKDGNGNYTIIDTAYTRKTENRYVNQNIGLNFQTTKEKYEYTVGLNISPSYSRSKVNIGDSIIDNLKQNVVNYSPDLKFSYKPNDNTSLDFNYSGTTNQPGISQLSPDTVIVSAMSKYYGNPNLKPGFNHNFNAYYQKSDYETNRFLFISGSFNYTSNNAVNYSIIDEKGNSTNTYRNVNGNMGANLNVMYNTPLRNKKFSVNNGTYVSYYKNIGFSNGDKSITNNVVLNESVSGKFKSSKFETNLMAFISYNLTRNNLAGEEDRNTTTYGLKHFVLWKLPYDFSIQSRLNFTYYSGYEDNFKKREVLWNASVDKKFLRNKKGTLRLRFFDILNDRNNIQRYVSGNYMSDSRSNTVNRYFMLSFSYQFNIIKNKGKKSEEPQDDNMYYDF
ncbi:MAG: outer membrane beta-barrel protein [Prevotella sp.]|jgi:hypothetical protein|nr:outer membrane beta-barrel protein [Prevotella sp.]